MGIEIVVQDEGPDICCQIGGWRTWIEAIAPNEGSGDDKVVQVASGQVGSVPDDQIIMRYTSAFTEKHRKFQLYAERKIVGENDIKVIAISGAKVPLADVEDIPHPRILQALLGVGEPIRNANRAEIPTTLFLDRAHSDISAVLFCRHHFKNSAEVRGLEPGRDWQWVHNPLARVPMPRGALQSGEEYWFELRHRGWRKPLEGNLVRALDWIRRAFRFQRR